MVNGFSLTVNLVNDVVTEQAKCIIDINIIPHTLQNTTLAALKVDDQVNLEVDLIARYVARILDHRSSSA